MARASVAASTETTPRPATPCCGFTLHQRGILDLHNACSLAVFPHELFALSCHRHIHHPERITALTFVHLLKLTLTSVTYVIYIDITTGVSHAICKLRQDCNKTFYLK
jgi:hypothetical protein